MRTFLFAAFALAGLSFAICGCGPDRGIAPSAFNAGSVRPASSNTQYAYVSDNNPNGHVYYYALPLTPSSQPLWDFTMSTTSGDTAVGKNQVYVEYGYPGQNLGVLVYQPEKKGAISFTLAVPANAVLVVNGAYDLFEGQTYTSGSLYEYQVNVFTPPITKNSVPAFTINAAVNHNEILTRGIGFDTHGNLWVKDDDKGTMDRYRPPFSSKSHPDFTFVKESGTPYGSLVFDKNGVMYVTNGNGLDVYQPPFTKKTKKAFTILVPAAPVKMTIDRVGNMYVGCYNSGNIYVYAPPFTPSSKPQVTMPIPGNPAAGGLSVKP